MQIKVEIEVKPEELRRFLGLPDVSGLQDEVLNFVREKMGQASDGLTPAAEFVRDKVGQATEGLSPAADFVRDNLGNLREQGAATLQKILQSVKVRLIEPEAEASPAAAAAATTRKRKAAATAATAKPRAKKSGAKRPAST